MRNRKAAQCSTLSADILVRRIQLPIVALILVLGAGSPIHSQTRTIGTAFSNPQGTDASDSLPDAPSTLLQEPQNATASVSGTITDQDGAVHEGVHITLEPASKGGSSVASRTAVSDSNGQFRFTDLPSGIFQLIVSSPGFQPRTISGTLNAGEALTVPKIVLLVAATTTQVEVTASTAEIAQAQLQQEEQQRLFAVIPNFYTVYDQHPVPLTPKQKYKLAFRFTADPSSFVITGIIAGVEQASNQFKGYGQGAEGYGKRYAAAYGDFLISNLLSNAVLPVIFRQDPRYYYKGTGGWRSRALYAIANSVVRKGDNGRWQPDYSDILGGLAAGGISNLYYPAKDRNGVALTFESAAIGIGGSAVGNLFQEFLSKKITPKAPKDKLPTNP